MNKSNCGCGPIQGVGNYGATDFSTRQKYLETSPLYNSGSYGSTLLYIGIGALLIGGGFYWYMSK